MPDPLMSGQALLYRTKKKEREKEKKCLTRKETRYG
jgi:hypothetical protein